MTLGEFRIATEGLPEDMQIVMSKDREGNTHTPVDDLAIGIYTPFQTPSYQGEFQIYLDEEEIREVPEKDCNAVCLFPVG